jgi:CRP-like cAMP-binding protein
MRSDLAHAIVKLPVAPFDELVALDGIGTRLRIARNQEIYADGDGAAYWYRVVAGAVRVSKLLPDGRRHIADFRFAGDFFGFAASAEHQHFAEAIDDVIVMCYPRAAVERLAEERPGLARRLRELAFAGLAAAQMRMLVLGRMTAGERVASFLVDFAERTDREKLLDLPMSRYDIADYLGLTIETVSRVLAALKRVGAIAMPSVHRIELLDRSTLLAA